MDEITHEVRLEQWKHIISECLARPEGQTAKQWLAEKGIPEKTYGSTKNSVVKNVEKP